jgi:hypothetical protein
MREEKSKCYDEGTFGVRYTRGGEVWDVHGRRGEGVHFIFSPEVTPTIPEDVVGRSGVVWEFEVEIPRLGIESEVFEVLADSQVIGGRRLGS